MTTSTSSATASSGSGALRCRTDFLRRYLAVAPLPLALERTCEAEILCRRPFERPVLDLGCGDGLFAHIVFEDPIDLGVDIDPRELTAARRWGGYRELVECDAASIPRPDGTFKTILSNSVLEHIPQLDAVLREARRLLAPDGAFYVTVPTHLFDHHSVAYQALAGLGLGRLAERWRVGFNEFWRHHHYHDPAAWAERFRGHGFEVAEVIEYCPRGLGTLNDALVPFSAMSLVNKKLFGRWVLLEAPRRAWASVVGPALAPLTSYRPDGTGGGIVFFALRPR